MRAAPIGSASAITAGAPMVFTIGTPVDPNEVWFGLSSSQPLRQLSAHNEGFKRSYELVRPEEIKFKSFDGKSIQGWLMKPAGWRSDRSYPLILSIHGGSARDVRLVLQFNFPGLCG